MLHNLIGRYVFWEKMMEFKLEIYAPETEVVAIRDALNSVGAGVVGDYDSVISIVKISGFWRPTEGSEPVTGEKGEINFGEEVRIDVRCQESLVQAALDAIRRTSDQHFTSIQP
ncbi:nitrogen regulatory protein PII [Vibrio harveyi]|uniref:Nitrogen regulatory protein PII n=1 Tax=Vibrio harveyi TaxID=669 RepID=A0A454CT42_VIBHA|nr:nitrogen regulatory protein PII [Vibrio harveyi]